MVGGLPGTMALADEIRRDLACARTGADWQGIISTVTTALTEDHPSPDDLRRAVAGAAIASNYCYLLGDPPKAKYLLDLAEQRREGERSEENRAELDLAVAVGWHRLYRNLGDYQSLRRLYPRLHRVYRHVLRTRPQSEQLEEWRFELSHLARYDGCPEYAIAEYRALACRLPNKPGYRKWLALHFVVSALCDLAEVMLVPAGKNGDRTTTRRLLDHLLGLFHGPDDEHFPMVAALFAKHRALWHAGMGQEREALAEIAKAKALLSALESKKALLLCQEFEALILAVFGDEKGALRELEQIRPSADGYYQRLVRHTDLHIGMLTDAEDPLLTTWHATPLQSVCDRYAAGTVLYPSQVPFVPATRGFIAAHMENLLADVGQWVPDEYARLNGGRPRSRPVHVPTPPHAEPATTTGSAGGGVVAGEPAVVPSPEGTVPVHMSSNGLKTGLALIMVGLLGGLGVHMKGGWILETTRPGKGSMIVGLLLLFFGLVAAAGLASLAGVVEERAPRKKQQR